MDFWRAAKVRAASVAQPAWGNDFSMTHPRVRLRRARIGATIPGKKCPAAGSQRLIKKIIFFYI
jgi:hypothetical protein